MNSDNTKEAKVRESLLELLREIRPMADYGRVGTRDVDQARYQRALDAAIARLAGQGEQTASLAGAAEGEPQPCKRCHGDGCTNEGDPEIGNAYFECTACGGTGRAA